MVPKNNLLTGICIGLVVISLFFSSPAKAASIYYVSTSGNDSNPGTMALPWLTIQHAANTMVSGDTAIVSEGTYPAQVNVSTSGVTLQANGKVITNEFDVSGNSNTVKGFTITDPSSNWGIRTTGKYNLIEGNEIYHTLQDGIWFFGDHNTFRGNYIHDILDPSNPTNHTDCFQTWGSDWGATNITIEKNLCINNAIGGNNQLIMLEGGTTTYVHDIIIRNNIFIATDKSPAPMIFWLASGETPIYNITIENNTIASMNAVGNTGIILETATNVTIINNLFVNYGSPRYSYVAVQAGSTANIHNNAIYNTDGIPPIGGHYPGDVWMQNPLVVSINGDYHLKSNSPLIDAGYNLGNLVPNDFDGVIRPQGTGYDIGAYEFPEP